MDLIRTPKAVISSNLNGSKCSCELKIENVRMLDRFNNKKANTGTLHLTATHLIFIDPEGKKEAWILHNHIANVTKLPISTTGSPLLIRCKNFLSVTFVIPRERESHDIYTSLLRLSQPINIEELYCFHYTASNEDLPKKSGWNKFDLQAEFARMGVPNDRWILTSINRDYEICDTYPKFLHVPASASTTVLVGSSRFRSRGRLPVLSYLHKNMAAICRCSQPLSGFSARCLEDEQLLNCILKSSPNSKYMYVVDTRPKINAMANKAAGKGYENEDFYKNIKFQFFGIENIHVMRNSLQKLLEACELKVPSMSAFLNGLESSGWLRHVKTVLEAAAFIAEHQFSNCPRCNVAYAEILKEKLKQLEPCHSKALEKGTSVLVHCSDGWDRTAQTCSLAALLLDPYYRTITGFQALIEKEWLAFGHKFTDRCGLVQGDPKEVAPVFTQFIDAAWQLTQQFPSSFQFNERFLLTIHDHVYSCQFGTFVGNCEKDRLDLRLNERTYSLWGYISNHLSEFLNPLYKRDSDGIMHPSAAPQSIKFWRGMYNRFENGVHPREPLSDMLVAAKDHISSLEDHILFLQKRISQLKTALGHAETPSKDIDCSMTDSGLYDDFAQKLQFKKTQQGIGDTADSGFENGNLNGGHIDDSPDGCLDNSLFSQLTDEMDSVALEWKTLRNVYECICSTPFDHFSRKFHCWSCGDVFCIRCIDKRIPLKGHFHPRPVPVCRHCYKELMRTNSIDS